METRSKFPILMCMHICADLHRVLNNPKNVVQAFNLWEILSDIDFEHAAWLLSHDFDKNLLKHWD